MPGGISTPAAGGAPAARGGAAPRVRSKPKAAEAEPLLSLDTKLDIIGGALILVALLTLLSFLSKESGALVRIWLRFIYQMFGWGAFVVPFVVGGIGIWLIWRRFGQNVPRPDPVRIAGGVLFFVALLVFMHAAVAASSPIGPLYINPALADPSTPGYTPQLIWEQAQACPARPQTLIDQGWIVQNGYWSSYDIAKCGHGGGLLGAFIQVSLQNLLGSASVFVIALAAMFAGALMATRTTLKEALQYISGAFQRMQRPRPAAAPAALQGATPSSTTPAPSRAAGGGVPAAPEGPKPPTPTPVPTGRPSIVTGLGPAGTPPTPSGAPAAGVGPAAPAPGTPTPAPPPRPAPASPTPTPLGERPVGPSGAPTPPPTPTGMPPAGLPGAPRPGSPPAPATSPTGPGQIGGTPSAPPERPATQPPLPLTGTGAPPRPSGPSPLPGRQPPEPAEQMGKPPGPPAMPGQPPSVRPGIPAGPTVRPPEPEDEEFDEDEGEDDESPGMSTGGPGPLPRPGAPPLPTRPVPGGPPPSGPEGPRSPFPRPAGPPSTAPSRPGPEPTRPGSGRTFGPPPPPSIGGARPAPKPTPPMRPEEELPPGDEDLDFDLDDLRGVDEEIDEATDLDERTPPTDQIIKELIDDDGKGASGAHPPAMPPRPPVVGRPTQTPETEWGIKPGGLSMGGSAPTPARSTAAPVVAPSRPPVPTAVPRPAPTGEAVSTRPPKVEAEKKEEKPIWKLPPLDMLEPGDDKGVSEEELRQRAAIIEQTLASFGAPARVVEVNHGPVITQFGLEPDYIDGRAGKRVKVKVGKISALADDLALSLAAPSIRIEAPVPGKGYVGVEVPNAQPGIVRLREVMDTPEFRALKSPLKLALGKNVSGEPIVADLTAMPHLLIAGTTGSGKSVCINGIICTMLMTCTPDQLKMIMVDPKRVELTNYNGIPHLMAPVVTELERIVGVLKWVQREMDDRYRKFAMAGARNITDYNSRVEKGTLEGERLPYIILIVDELADLMMLAPDETERVVTRLAQMARATGIHIIISTQRPSVDVVTGLIKANFPARIAFAVATSVDSRVILDMPGAEKLLGRGDMLFQSPDAPMPVRLQGVFVSDEEIERLVNFWREQAAKMPSKPGVSLTADAATMSSATTAFPSGTLVGSRDDDDEDVDDLFDEAVELVRSMEKASISLLQRHLRIGYTRAARLIDLMEERGVIGPHAGGSAPRVVLDENGTPLSNGTSEEEDEEEADE